MPYDHIIASDSAARGAPPIPEVFCWTKMGAEAGQSLDVILRRKELERRSGNGIFAWGIGNSLGAAPDLARQQSPDGEVDVLFTPMKSAAKQIDAAPSQVLLWLGFLDPNGRIADLPHHILVTSRGGSEKRGHYALICHSTDEIRDYSIEAFDAAYARNLASLNPIGASQVTSVVRYGGSSGAALEKPYRVAFRAKLSNQGFVRLVRPVVMEGDLLRLYRKVCDSTDVVDWLEGAKMVRAAALGIFHQQHHRDDLFAELL